MRSHLIMLETNIIKHFPQNPQYVVQKVLPLAVLKTKEAETIQIANVRYINMKRKNRNQLD